MREDDALITIRHAQKLKKRKFHHVPPAPSRSGNALRPLSNPCYFPRNSNETSTRNALPIGPATDQSSVLETIRRITDTEADFHNRTKPKRRKNALILLLSSYDVKEDIITWFEFLRAHLVENRPDADYRFGLRMHFSRSWNVIIREKWGWMPVQSEFKIYRAENDVSGVEKRKNFLLGYARIDNTWEYNKLTDALQIWESTTNQLLKYTVPLLFYHCEDDEETDYWRIFIITPYYSRKLMSQLREWKRRDELDFKRIVNVFLDISMAVAEYHLKENAAQLVMLNYIRPNSFVYDEADDTFLLFDLTPAVAVSKYLRSLGKTELHMQHLRSALGYRYVAPELHGYTSHLSGEVDPPKLDDWQVGVAFWEILCACYSDNDGIRETSDKTERRLLTEHNFSTQNFSYMRPHPFLMALVQLLTTSRPRDRLEIWQVIDLLCLMCDDREHPFGPYPYEPVTLDLLTTQLRHDVLTIGLDEEVNVDVNNNFDDVNFIFRTLQWLKSEAYARYTSKKSVSNLVNDNRMPINRVRTIMMESGETCYFLPRRVQNAFNLVPKKTRNDNQLSMFANYSPSVSSHFLILDTLEVSTELDDHVHCSEQGDESLQSQRVLNRMTERSKFERTKSHSLRTFYRHFQQNKARQRERRQKPYNDIELEQRKKSHFVEWNGLIAVKRNLSNKQSASKCRAQLYSTGMLKLVPTDEKPHMFFKQIMQNVERLSNDTPLAFCITRPCVLLHETTIPTGFLTTDMLPRSWFRRHCFLLYRKRRKTQRRRIMSQWRSRTDMVVQFDFETLDDAECFNYFTDSMDEVNIAEAELLTAQQLQLRVRIPECLTKHCEWFWFRFETSDEKAKFFAAYRRLRPNKMVGVCAPSSTIELSVD